MATKKEILEKSQKAIGEYFKLSSYLFGDDAPNEVNEIPSDSPFYGLAKELADEMKLDWDNMSHEDSNRIMLNMLSEYFYEIIPDKDYKPVLSISFDKKK